MGAINIATDKSTQLMFPNLVTIDDRFMYQSIVENFKPIAPQLTNIGRLCLAGITGGRIDISSWVSVREIHDGFLRGTTSFMHMPQNITELQNGR